MEGPNRHWQCDGVVNGHILSVGFDQDVSHSRFGFSRSRDLLEIDL